LLRLAAIIRGADTGVPDLTLQSGGLLALSLGYPQERQLWRDRRARSASIVFNHHHFAGIE
jgi:hypothetical protein